MRSSTFGEGSERRPAAVTGGKVVRLNSAPPPPPRLGNELELRRPSAEMENLGRVGQLGAKATRSEACRSFSMS